jgi:metal-responsive CopG/Arc/MetJ family transcriptional regulator
LRTKRKGERRIATTVSIDLSVLNHIDQILEGLGPKHNRSDLINLLLKLGLSDFEGKGGSKEEGGSESESGGGGIV